MTCKVREYTYRFFRGGGANLFPLEHMNKDKTLLPLQPPLLFLISRSGRGRRPP